MKYNAGKAYGVVEMQLITLNFYEIKALILYKVTSLCFLFLQCWFLLMYNSFINLSFCVLMPSKDGAIFILFLLCLLKVVLIFHKFIPLFLFFEMERSLWYKKLNHRLVALPCGRNPVFHGLLICFLLWWFILIGAGQDHWLSTSSVTIKIKGSCW